MESKEYFEKIMQDYNQNGKGRSLRKYCKDEAVDYNWLIEFRKTYPARSNDREKPASTGLIPLEVEKRNTHAADDHGRADKTINNRALRAVPKFRYYHLVISGDVGLVVYG